jgi:hypothetical protein
MPGIEADESEDHDGGYATSLSAARGAIATQLAASGSVPRP